MVVTSRPKKTRQQIEEEMIEALRQRQAEWQSATADTRHFAEQRFLKTLKAFTALVVDGKLPDE